MRLFIVSDFHLGKYSLNSDKWLDNMRSYFYDFFIPLLKEYSKENDKLLVLGDIFDNRNSIDLRALNLAVEIFEDISKILECHVLLGNHDQRMMNDPNINSVVSIRNINNVFVYSEPTEITFDNKTALMMPWVNGKDSEIQILEKYSGKDLLFCHSDLNGCRTQLNPTRPSNKNILDIEDFKGYNKIYSGHIHIVQTIQNFTFVGSPYHLDRNDISNTKGVFVYDTRKNKDIFIPNDFSPEFKKVKILKEKDIDKLKPLLNTNNFIDVEISNTLIVNNPQFRLQFDKLTNKHKLEEIYYIDDIVKEKKQRNTIQSKRKTIEEISYEWINNLNINEDTDLFTKIDLVDEMKQTVEKCFKLLN